MSIIVYKLGGSLLTLGDLASRLGDVLSQRPDERPLLIVGGGATADVVRDWDRIHQLGDERAHWLGLEAMRLNEALLLELLSTSCSVVNRTEAIEAWGARRIPILRASEFVRSEEGKQGPNLPHNWDVTSDSIAAWVTLRWPADELMLLKSVAAPANGALTARRAGADDKAAPVDPYFHSLASELPSLGWINLRQERFRRTQLRTHS